MKKTHINVYDERFYLKETPYIEPIIHSNETDSISIESAVNIVKKLMQFSEREIVITVCPEINRKCGKEERTEIHLKPSRTLKILDMLYGEVCYNRIGEVYPVRIVYQVDDDHPNSVNFQCIHQMNDAFPLICGNEISDKKIHSMGLTKECPFSGDFKEDFEYVVYSYLENFLNKLYSDTGI